MNYNARTFLRKCLNSIKMQQMKDDIEVIIFDNNSTDDSKELIKKEYRKVKLIESERNLGFAEANNCATKIATEEYIFFLNPDTRLDKDCISILLNFAKRVKDEDFILIPKQVSYDKGKFLTLGLAADIFGYPNTAYSDNGKRQIRPIFYADGAAFFIPKKTFIKLGMLDEELFMFQEDIDLSWKAHLMGIKLYPVANAVVFHKVGAVAGGGLAEGKKYETNLYRRYLSERNLLRNMIKNYSFYNLIWILPLNFLINLLEIMLFLLLKKPKVSLCYLRAYGWNFRNIKSAFNKRVWIQNHRIVPDRKILNQMVKIPSKLYLLVRVGIPKIG